MPREIRQTGRYEVDEDQVRIIDAKGRVVPHRLRLHGRRARGPARTIDAVIDDVSALEIARRVGITKEAEGPLGDVPLIVEDLLCQARQLADSGAPTEAVKAILDHVAALREGRG